MKDVSAIERQLWGTDLAMWPSSAQHDGLQLRWPMQSLGFIRQTYLPHTEQMLLG